jgi:hypothetical protein
MINIRALQVMTATVRFIINYVPLENRRFLVSRTHRLSAQLFLSITHTHVNKSTKGNRVTEIIWVLLESRVYLSIMPQDLWSICTYRAWSSTYVDHDPFFRYAYEFNSVWESYARAYLPVHLHSQVCSLCYVLLAAATRILQPHALD